jgi:hypothetical protein
MPITLPNLDDRRYADLVEEALAIIPVHAPEWTNHNPSDPGITLVELFAYLTEILIYRLNRVTVENVVAFLNLIDAGERRADDYRDRAKLSAEVSKVVTELRKPYRAITCEDFNELVGASFSNEVARVFTTTLKNKRIDGKNVDFISVFVVPVLLSTVLLQTKEGYSDHTNDVRTPGNIAFRLVSEENKYLYIGRKSKFDAIKFSLHVAVSDYKLRFEYFSGGGDAAGNSADDAQWSTLTKAEHKLLDLTSNWASSGLVVFEPPADWRPSSVDEKSMYWVRVSAEKPPTKQDDPSAFQVAIHSVPVLPPDETDQSLLNRIRNELKKRRMLTTRLNVAGPSDEKGGFTLYKKMAVRHITLHLKHDALEADVCKAAKEELSRFFHPLIGGRDGKGWPFGRDVYLSEVIERLAGLAGVAFVENAKCPIYLIHPRTGKAIQQPDNTIKLDPFELVDFRINDSEFATTPAPDPRGSRKSK